MAFVHVAQKVGRATSVKVQASRDRCICAQLWLLELGYPAALRRIVGNCGSIEYYIIIVASTKYYALTFEVDMLQP